MPASITVSDLWTAIRGCENALRHHADTIYAAQSAIGRHDVSIAVEDDSLVTRVRAPFTHCCHDPFPPCPPYCEVPSPTGVAPAIQDVATKVDAIARIVAIYMIQVSEALARDNKTSFFAYVSEKPGTFWRH